MVYIHEIWEHIISSGENATVARVATATPPQEPNRFLSSLKDFGQFFKKHTAIMITVAVTLVASFGSAYLGASVASEKNSFIQFRDVRQAQYTEILLVISQNSKLDYDLRLAIQNKDLREARKQAEQMTPVALQHLIAGLALLPNQDILRQAAGCTIDLEAVKKYMSVTVDEKLESYTSEDTIIRDFNEVDGNFKTCSLELTEMMRNDLDYPVTERKVSRFS